jgi:hypothetical protein
MIHHANPKYGPVYMGKYDLSDGLYRAKLLPRAALKLAAILPRYPGEVQLVALPLTLPMGWINSIPYFCALTKTVADLAANTPTNRYLPHHPMEDATNTPPPPDSMFHHSLLTNDLHQPKSNPLHSSEPTHETMLAAAPTEQTEVVSHVLSNQQCLNETMSSAAAPLEPPTAATHILNQINNHQPGPTA